MCGKTTTENLFKVVGLLVEPITVTARTKGFSLRHIVAL